MHITKIGFITPSGLYGHTYGMPIVRMSVCPVTSTNCCS